jgi:hypothetical protein
MPLNPNWSCDVISRVACPFAIFVAGAVSGCNYHAAYIPSPPVPASCSSNKDMDGLHFSFHKWKEGLAILFVDRINGSVDERGSLDGDTYVERGSVKRADGTGYDWQIKTKDGRSADLTVNDVPYDLNKGRLFAIQLDGNKVIVHQLDRDISQLNIDLRQCTAFVNNSRDIVELVTGKSIRE